MATKRETLVQAVVARFKEISPTNGYRTDVGRNVTAWHVKPVEDTQLPYLDVRDMNESTEEPLTNHHEHTLKIGAYIAVAAGPYQTASITRDAISDVWQCIGVDRTWGGVALTSRPLSSELDVDNQDGKTLGRAHIEFDIVYRTRPFNPDV
jgi:hypothetical protein